jgi:putative membrane protein
VLKLFQSFLMAWLLPGLLLNTAVLAVHGAENEEMRGRLSSSDYKFVKAAACGGMMEVELGKIAAQKSATPSVQHFGEQMVTDHGKADQQLKDIASRNGATLPTQLDEDQQKEVDKLNSLSGDDFDKKYISLMVHDHKKDLKEFEHASKNAENADLKTFAADTTSVIQKHLDMAESLKTQSSKTSSY